MEVGKDGGEGGGGGGWVKAKRRGESGKHRVKAICERRGRRVDWIAKLEEGMVTMDRSR